MFWASKLRAEAADTDASALAFAFSITSISESFNPSSSGLTIHYSRDFERAAQLSMTLLNNLVVTGRNASALL